MLTYLVLGFSDAGYVEDYRQDTADVPALVTAVQDGLPPELAELGRDAEASVDALVENLDRFAGYGAAGTEPADVSEDPELFELDPGLVDGLVTLLETTPAVEADIDALHAELDARLADERNEIDDLQQLLVVGTLATVVAALVVASVGTYVANNGGVGRIERLTQNADRFIQDVPLLPFQASADEIGQLTDKMLFAGELLDSRRARAVAATRAKVDFRARVSHELKTPLTAMIGFAPLLEEDPELSPAGREDAAHIVAAGHHLHDLIQELLDTRAIEAGKLAVAIEPIRVGETAEDAISLVRSMPASRTIAITADCPDHAVVAADRRRLREVVLNLLSNAVTYNRADGHVGLVAEPGGDTVRISVTDTGPGIAPDDQTRPFQPFERLAAADSDVEGSGVGLALTKHVIEVMGGTQRRRLHAGARVHLLVHPPCGERERVRPRRRRHLRRNPRCPWQQLRRAASQPLTTLPVPCRRSPPPGHRRPGLGTTSDVHSRPALCTPPFVSRTTAKPARPRHAPAPAVGGWTRRCGGRC